MSRRLFDFEKASGSAGWLKELNEEHAPETEEYGISSFVYRRRKPFHPQRFHDWLLKFPGEIIRSKGLFWLATRQEMAGLLSQAGASIVFQGAGQWVAAMPEEERQAAILDDPGLAERWHEEHGDRQTELVFIGLDMDRASIERSLDDCLATEEEMAAGWNGTQDPLPQFV